MQSEEFSMKQAKQVHQKDGRNAGSGQISSLVHSESHFTGRMDNDLKHTVKAIPCFLRQKQRIFCIFLLLRTKLRQKPHEQTTAAVKAWHNVTKEATSMW